MIPCQSLSRCVGSWNMHRVLIQQSRNSEGKKYKNAKGKKQTRKNKMTIQLLDFEIFRFRKQYKYKVIPKGFL